MSLRIFKCIGGEIILPDKNLILVSRKDGGNLVVNPSRKVWERGELTSIELTNWSFLIAATGQAMLENLPQLTNGCINYWEAGNWALNEFAEPVGVFKPAQEFRQVHLHLLGRNPNSTDPNLLWGESPIFPKFKDRFDWAKNYQRLNREECVKIVQSVRINLLEIYGFQTSQIEKWTICQSCNYPIAEAVCPECI